METKIKVAENESILAMHAHVCANCLKSGKQVLWMHGNEKGNVDAHTCPECGSNEKGNWIKTHVPTGQLPGSAAAAPKPFITAYELADTLILVTLAGMAIYWILAIVGQLRRMNGEK